MLDERDRVGGRNTHTDRRMTHKVSDTELMCNFGAGDITSMRQPIGSTEFTATATHAYVYEAHHRQEDDVYLVIRFD